MAVKMKSIKIVKIKIGGKNPWAKTLAEKIELVKNGGENPLKKNFKSWKIVKESYENLKKKSGFSQLLLQQCASIIILKFFNLPLKNLKIIPSFYDCFLNNV